MERLRGVPGVVRLLQAGTSPDPYLVYEMVPGQTLEAILTNGGMTLGEALIVMARLATIVAGVHTRGVVHCDLKPENVIVRSSSRLPVLLDFGVAEEIGGRSDGLSGISGTPRYMAPEAFDEQSAFTPAQDLYALGVMLYRVCVGRLPFQGKTVPELMGQHMFVLAPHLPFFFHELIRDLVAACLEKVPGRRLSDARVFARALFEGVAELGALADGPIPGVRLPLLPRRLGETVIDYSP